MESDTRQWEAEGKWCDENENHDNIIKLKTGAEIAISGKTNSNRRQYKSESAQRWNEMRESNQMKYITFLSSFIKILSVCIVVDVCTYTCLYPCTVTCILIGGWRIKKIARKEISGCGGSIVLIFKFEKASEFWCNIDLQILFALESLHRAHLHFIKFYAKSLNEDWCKHQMGWRSID